MSCLDRFARVCRIGAIVATIGLAGCSGQDSESDASQAVAATLDKLQSAFATGDMAAICRHLTGPAQRQAGSVAHGQPTIDCEQDMRRAFKVIAGGLNAPAPTVGRVRVQGASATATLIDAQGRWKADVPLVDSGGRWKLAGFFGAAPAAVEALESSAPARPFPIPDGKPANALGQDGERCPDLSDARYPEISGGCAFEVSSKSVPVQMLTPFGVLDFADCTISYRLSIDATGRTWTDRWAAADTTQPGCSDIDPCKAGPFDYHPWKGRLVKDPRGGYLHHTDMCLRTCIGNFTGEFVVRLTRRNGRWNVEPTDRGATGFKIDGALTTPGDALALDGGA